MFDLSHIQWLLDSIPRIRQGFHIEALAPGPWSSVSKATCHDFGSNAVPKSNSLVSSL